MNLEKLKDTARKHEQKEDWRRAIDVYLKAIHEFEAGPEPTPDLSLYNRVGDLYLKVNDTAAAVRSYERAVDLYADQGFLNNAIALCGKILRVNPARLPTYLKLAQLHARKNFLHDAKRYLIEYLERMNGVGQLDEAFQAVKGFADQFQNNQDLRLMLVELLRASSRDDEAREQLEKLAGELEARGDRAGAQKTREQLEALGGESAEVAVASSPRRDALVFLDTSEQEEAAAGESAEAAAAEPLDIEPTITESADEGEDEPSLLEDLQATSFGVELGPEGSVELDGLVRTSPGDLEVEPAPDLELEPTAELEIEQTPDLDLDLELERLPGAELGDESDLVLEPELESVEPAAELQLETQDFGDIELDDEAAALDPLELETSGAGGVDLEFEQGALEGDLDAGLWADGAAEPDEAARLEPAGAPELPYVDLGGDADLIAQLEDRVLDDPGSPEVHRMLAEALVSSGQTDRAAEEYDLARQAYEEQEDWAAALAMSDRQLQVDRDNVTVCQKRVELAFRTGDRGALLGAYLGLADLLVRLGAGDKAVVVYQRVLEHDASNETARAAIAELTAAPAAPAAPADRVEEPDAGPPVAAPATPPAAARPAPNGRAEGADFVDLGSMIIEHEGPRDTRMKVEHEQPTGDEQRDFEEMLDAFKRGIEQNLGNEDFQAHYDLGVAFKEMGLLDEAIAEFQKALRAPEGRLRTSEALGVCFFEKSQYAVAEAVLRRAVEGIEGGDDEKIGLIYWLGRAAEEQGKEREALASYQRALAVDIRFMDLGARINRLTAGQRS